MGAIQFPCNIGEVHNPSHFDVPVLSEFGDVGFRGSEVRNEYEWGKQRETYLLYLLLVSLCSYLPTTLGEPMGVGLKVMSELESA